jgi:hypothetical protein
LSENSDIDEAEGERESGTEKGEKRKLDEISYYYSLELLPDSPLN